MRGRKYNAPRENVLYAEFSERTLVRCFYLEQKLVTFMYLHNLEGGQLYKFKCFFWRGGGRFLEGVPLRPKKKAKFNIHIYANLRKLGFVLYQELCVCM